MILQILLAIYSKFITFCPLTYLLRLASSRGDFVPKKYDQQGLDCYKLYNNEILTQTNQSGLGVALDSSEDLKITAVGQADDTALLSNNLFKLHLLLYLVLEYCKKYNVQLSFSKNKLLQISPPGKSSFNPYNPVKIKDKNIEFVNQAEHVGIIRSVEGNMPHILTRISSIRKALGSLSSCGLSKGHRTNPLFLLRILTLYGIPLLMSGLGSVFLSIKETALID